MTATNRGSRMIENGPFTVYGPSPRYVLRTPSWARAEMLLRNLGEGWIKDGHGRWWRLRAYRERIAEVEAEFAQQTTDRRA